MCMKRGSALFHMIAAATVFVTVGCGGSSDSGGTAADQGRSETSEAHAQAQRIIDALPAAPNSLDPAGIADFYIKWVGAISDADGSVRDPLIEHLTDGQTHNELTHTSPASFAFDQVANGGNPSRLQPPKVLRLEEVGRFSLQGTSMIFMDNGGLKWEPLSQTSAFIDSSWSDAVYSSSTSGDVLVCIELTAGNGAEATTHVVCPVGRMDSSGGAPRFILDADPFIQYVDVLTDS